MWAFFFGCRYTVLCLASGAPSQRFLFFGGAVLLALRKGTTRRGLRYTLHANSSDGALSRESYHLVLLAFAAFFLARLVLTFFWAADLDPTLIERGRRSKFYRDERCVGLLCFLFVGVL